MLVDPSGGLACDYGAMHLAEVEVASAAAGLDAAGATMPSGDYGDVAGPVAVLMAALAETAARLVAEAKVLGLGLRVASADMEATDAEQALRYVEVGR